MYSIKRGAATIATVRPESGVQKQKIMGENVVDMTFTLTSPVAFEIGDTVVVYGQTYVLNTLPAVSKTAEKQIKYTCQFESVGYDLSKALFMFYDENEELTVPEFSLIGNAEVFIDLIIANANRDQSGWTKGVIEETPVKNLTFSGENCSAVLSTLAVEFENEFWIEGKTIHFSKKGEDTGLTFAYGKGNGLYNVDRSNINSNGIITRLYAFGGERNVPADYGSKRLKIDPIENNVEAFGVIEGVVNFDDVYPRRIGTVSAVDGHLKFSDSGIDFNVNDQLMPGVTAKVQFLTGDLAGYELELTGYNHSTKQFTLKVVEEEKAIEVPSVLLKAAVGDTYQLVDIIMPSSYVTAAEEELEERAVAYMAINSVPRVQYSVSCDPLHFKREGIALSLGELVTIEDEPLGIEELIRIVGLERSIILDGIEQYKYTLELSESVQPSRVVREAVREEKIDKLVKLNRLDDPQRARNNWRTTAELTTMLEALKAEMLLIMVDGSVFETNIFATVTEDNFVTTAGSLVNQQYEGTWSVSASSNTLASNVPYYVYVKASKSDSTATIVISATKIAVEEVSGFYHFMFGIISSKVSGTRVFTSTKGYTRIIGNNIQTGSIISINGRTYFDLDEGVIELAESAGISGNGTTSTSVRFWAGKSYSNRATAPFRVDHAGKLYASEAEISGKITAGVGSVIGGVEIGSDGKFNLVGSKVEIKPDEGIKVFDGGYSDFTGSKMFIPHSLGATRKVSISAATDGSGGVIPPPPITSVTWGMITGTLSGQADLMTALNGKAPLNGVGATGNWPISITGNAATWRGQNLITSTEDSNPPWLMTLSGTNSGIIGKSALQTWLGLNNGSLLNNNISGSAAQWNGYSNDYSGVETNPDYIMVFKSGVGRVINSSLFSTWMGFGNYAYRSSGLAELTGATFTGAVQINSSDGAVALNVAGNNTINWTSANSGTIEFGGAWANVALKTNGIQRYVIDGLGNHNFGAGNASFGSKIKWGVGTAVAGESAIFNHSNPAYGTVLLCKPATTLDFILTNGSGFDVMYILSGTINTQFIGDVGFGTSPTTGGSDGRWISFDGANSYSGGSIFKRQGIVRAYQYMFGDYLTFQTTPNATGFQFQTNNGSQTPLSIDGFGVTVNSKLYIPHNLGSTRKVSISAAI